MRSLRGDQPPRAQKKILKTPQRTDLDLAGLGRLPEGHFPLVLCITQVCVDGRDDTLVRVCKGGCHADLRRESRALLVPDAHRRLRGHVRRHVLARHQRLPRGNGAKPRAEGLLRQVLGVQVLQGGHDEQAGRGSKSDDAARANLLSWQGRPDDVNWRRCPAEGGAQGLPERRPLARRGPGPPLRPQPGAAKAQRRLWRGLAGSQAVLLMPGRPGALGEILQLAGRRLRRGLGGECLPGVPENCRRALPPRRLGDQGCGGSPLAGLHRLVRALTSIHVAHPLALMFQRVASKPPPVPRQPLPGALPAEGGELPLAAGSPPEHFLLRIRPFQVDAQEFFRMLGARVLPEYPHRISQSTLECARPVLGRHVEPEEERHVREPLPVLGQKHLRPHMSVVGGGGGGGGGLAGPGGGPAGRRGGRCSNRGDGGCAGRVAPAGRVPCAHCHLQGSAELRIE